jgi:integrase
VASLREGLSLRWDGRQWFARYKTIDGTWSAKRVPTKFSETQEGAATKWILGWYATYLAGAGYRPDDHEVKPGGVSLADIAKRWHAYREGDRGTDPGYAKSLKSQYETWIAPHEIAKVDVETQLTPLRIVQWMTTLRGKASTRLTVASTLSVMLNDAILHGDQWGVSPNLAHPMLNSPQVHRALTKLRSERANTKVTTILSPAEVTSLLTLRDSKVLDVRRAKYALALSTGMRDGELQGLIWDDVKDLPTPHVWVLRQLVQAGPAPFVWVDDVRAELGEEVDLAEVGKAVCKPPKRDSRRALPLLPLAASVLAWWKATGWRQYVGRAPKDADPIFPTGLRNSHRPRGEFCTPVSGSMLLKDMKRLGLSTTYTSPHNGLTAEHTSRSLRHTFATMLSQVGVDDGRIGDLLGHGKSTVTRQHYIETLLSSRIEAVSKLPLPDHVAMAVVDVRDPSKPAVEPGRVLRLGTSVPKARS